jgi:hypothetical protein
VETLSETAYSGIGQAQKGHIYMSDVLSIPEAAAMYGINEKRLRGYIWRNGLMDPIGCLALDTVYNDWRLRRLAQ